MNKSYLKIESVVAFVLLVLLCLSPISSQAAIEGIAGDTFNLTAREGQIFTPDGGIIFMWGYANEAGDMQYPGPTLIVNEGAVVTINLTNNLPVPTSIVFPGQDVTTTGGTPGIITAEAPALTGTVIYSFTADHPGTYTYYSGTRSELQIEMGLVGAIIVRPTGFNLNNPRAYSDVDSSYDREYLFLLSEIDLDIHDLVNSGNMALIDNTAFFPVYWFINGRAFPDTIDVSNAPWLPTQPYSSFVSMYVGEKVLMRVIGAGRDLHPFHHHGNNATIIAKDGRTLSTPLAAGSDLAQSVFTITSAPGQTVDAIFEWTGEQLGWDIYGDPAVNGHSCNDDGSGFDPVTREYCPDHGMPFPVVLPEMQNVTIGGAFSGSPYLGQTGPLPPGEGGLNEPGAFAFPWHSHSEKEIINNDVFIGGMLTLAYVLPADTTGDSDGDGILAGDGTNTCRSGNTVNCDDNCVNDPNPDQADTDRDGIGDVCDATPDQNTFDANADCTISNFELLDAISVWAVGGIDNFFLLDLISMWANSPYCAVP